jgi:SUMO ligase MMS21 Smc5/6 complex component
MMLKRTFTKMGNEERQSVRDAQRMYDKFKNELENEKNHTDSNIRDFYRNLMAWCVEHGAVAP